MDRRAFLATSGAAGFAAALPTQVPAQAPSVKRSGPRPVVVASANGNHFKNGGTQTCVARAFSLMTEGKDVLEALVEGVSIVELDPEDTSVGYGGLPNAEGVVQLDASCMHGPGKGAVMMLPRRAWM
mgnify:CR=1 FL=1